MGSVLSPSRAARSVVLTFQSPFFVVFCFLPLGATAGLAQTATAPRANSATSTTSDASGMSDTMRHAIYAGAAAAVIVILVRLLGGGVVCNMALTQQPQGLIVCMCVRRRKKATAEKFSHRTKSLRESFMFVLILLDQRTLRTRTEPVAEQFLAQPAPRRNPREASRRSGRLPREPTLG